MNTDGRKMKLLTLKKIFEEQTDAEHCLTANQLVEKLNEVSIPAERKGIYDDIKVLNYFFKPADKRKEARATRIEKDEEGRGYYLENRLFSVADLKLMIDAIQSSKFLSEAKTMELIEALETLCSRHQARGLKRQVIVTNRVKNMNTNIHNNVGHVNYAIENDVQLGVCEHLHMVFRRSGILCENLRDHLRGDLKILCHLMHSVFYHAHTSPI